MASYGFHSEAADEYLAATRYYLDHAPPLVGAAFVAEIEAAIQTLLASPTTWPVIEEPQIRRYLLRRFPYSLYYRGTRQEGCNIRNPSFQQTAVVLASSL